ncbi:putative cohesin subunit rad21 [Amylocarpus encephaloides]|uniref:Cohesin subunit rad21 n=1 Tax=Amylocarpus encephaloides TaxID=45428 RepID=A0A9P8C4M8_9HELO|nr:putative cohesin subunit rad21 [Amylocarpus encephaloides]
MFFSDALLSKNGPLAKVWLAANIERKLTKNNILQASVKDSVDVMMNPDNTAPRALRLNGHLLLGIVRIYSRKARYLLDDCNEALMKIKMAFRTSSNNDIPAGLHMPSRDALMLPDVLTEGDDLDLPAMPDTSILFSQLNEEDIITPRKKRAGSIGFGMSEDFNNSQFLPSDKGNNDEIQYQPLDDIDLELDFGDFDVPQPIDQSIEVGRDAPEARAPEDDLLSDLDIDLGLEETAPVKDTIEPTDERDASLGLNLQDDNDAIHIDEDGNVEMLDIYDQPNDGQLPVAPLIPPPRISESPLSDYDETVIRQGELEIGERSLFDPEDESEDPTMVMAPHRARKAKLLEIDGEIAFSNAQIKERQQNRDKILRQQSFLPRDPELLALIEMQKNGGFISNIMGDARSMAWAPELRGMLSLNAIRQSGDLKRKRDSGVADMDIDEEQGAQKSPRLDVGEEEDDLPVGANEDPLSRKSMPVAADGTIIEMPGDDGFMPIQDDEDHNPNASFAGSPGANFDETTAPLVYPADSGPVSLGTKHAVHLLREKFGAEAANSPDKRKKASVLFQDLLPEARTSRADATKMFFEVLVLATKDAVKVEQAEGLLGGPIRVRGKRGLWGAWAETSAGGEISEEEEVIPGPSRLLEQSMAVAVAA